MHNYVHTLTQLITIVHVLRFCAHSNDALIASPLNDSQASLVLVWVENALNGYMLLRIVNKCIDVTMY